MASRHRGVYSPEELWEETSRRLARWCSGIPADPLRAIVLTTRRCNLDCWFCNSPTEERSGQAPFPPELTPEQWTPIIEEGVRLGIKDWWFTGTGEPLFRRKCVVSVIKTLKKKDPRAAFKITTNGTMFTENIISLFVRLGMSSVTFSIDGPTAAVHDGLRRKNGSFARAINALRLFAHYKEVFGMETPRLCFTYVLNARNYASLPEYIELANELGVEHITINPLRVTGGNKKKVESENLRILSGCMNECKNILNESKKLARRCDIDLHLNANELLEIGKSVRKEAPDFEDDGRKLGTFVNAPCLEPWYNVSIDPWGNVGYCANWGFGSFEHNVLKHGLRALWFGEPFIKVRESLLNHQPFDVCFGCGVYRSRDTAKKHLVEFINRGVG